MKIKKTHNLFSVNSLLISLFFFSIYKYCEVFNKIAWQLSNHLRKKKKTFIFVNENGQSHSSYHVSFIHKMERNSSGTVWVIVINWCASFCTSISGVSWDMNRSGKGNVLHDRQIFRLIFFCVCTRISVFLVCRKDINIYDQIESN